MNILDNIVQFIEANYSWLVYAPTIAFVVILLLWSFSGFLKGSRRSMWAFFLMLVSIGITGSVYFYFYQEGGKNLYYLLENCGVNFQSLLQKPVEGNSILSILQSYVFLYVGEQSQGVENIAIEMYPYIDVLAQALFKFVLFLASLVIYFAVLFVLNVFYFLFFRNGIKKRKLRKKGLKFKKHRIVGSFIGLVRGSIVGIVTLSFVGSLLFAVTGNKEANKEVTFTDDRIANIYDINNFVKELGNNGIFKILNDVKNEENTPYYLLITNAILSGNIGDQNYVLTDQFASFTGLANDMIDLIGKYGGKDLTLEILNGSDPAGAQKLLTDLFNNDQFNNDLINIIDKYQGTEYIKNLLKASTGSLIKNFGLLMGDLNPELKNEYMNFYDSVFEGVNSIKPGDLVTFDDVKTVFKAVVSSGKEIIKFTEYMPNASQNPDKNIILVNKALNVYECMFEYLDDLSIYKNNTADYNKLIDNSIKFAFTILKDPTGNPYPNPFEGQNIDWINDSKGLFGAVNNIAVITEELENYQVTNNTADLVTISKVFKNDYVNKEVIDTNYFELVDAVNEFSSVNALLSSEFFYSNYEKILNASLQTNDIKIPRNISWKDNGTNPGELRKIFNILRNCLGEGALDTVLNDITFSDLNTIKQVVLNLNNKFENSTLLEYLIESDFIHYTLSNVLLNLNNQAISIAVPSTCFEVIDNVNVISKLELKQLIKTLPVLLNEIPDLNVVLTDPLVFVDVLRKANVREQLISSNILSATASSTIYSLYNTNPTLQEYLLIPSKLAFVDPNNNDLAINNWIGHSGELNKLLTALEFVDVRKLMNNDLSAIVDITKLSRKDFDSLVSSTILSVSFPRLLTKFNNAQFSIIVPDDVYLPQVDEYPVINNDELYTMLSAANKILSVNPTTNQLDYNLDNILVYKNDVLRSEIISASIVNVLLTNTAVSSFLSIPTEFKVVDYKNFKNSVWMLGAETNSNEINNIFNTFDIFNLSLSDIVNGKIDQNSLVNKVLTLDEAYNGKTKIEAICDSKVLHLTLSNTLTTNPSINSNINVPAKAYVDNMSEDKYIKATEFLSLIKGLKNAFELNSNSDLITELSKVDTLIAKLFNNFGAKKNELLASLILEETIITKVADFFANTPASSVVVPTMLSLNNNEMWHATRNTNDAILADGELGKLLSILDATGIGKLYGTPDFVNTLNNALTAESIIYTHSDSLKPNADVILKEKEAKQQLLLTSDIVSATIINVLVGESKKANSIYLPQKYDVKTSVKEEYNLNSNWLLDNELFNIFVSLNEFKLPIVQNSFDFDVNNILSNEYDTNKLLTSNIIWFTFSNHLLNNQALYFNQSDVTADLNEKYLSKAEINNILSSTKILKPTNGAFDINNIKISTIFANYETNINLLLSSNTIELTLVKVLLDAFNTPNSQVKLPVEFSDYTFGANHVVDVLSSESLTRFTTSNPTAYGYDELRHLFDAINALDLADQIDNKQDIKLNINDFIENSSNTPSQNQEALRKQDILLNSVLLSVSLIDMVSNIGVTLPNVLDAEAKGLSTNTLRYTDETSKWRSNTEIKKLFKSLSVLDIKASANNNIVIEADKYIDKLTEANINVMHESIIIYLTVSNAIRSKLQDVFVSNKVIVPYSVDYNEQVLTTTELFNLTNGAKLLFGGSFGGAVTLPKAEDVNTILKSQILSNTISQRVISEALGTSAPQTFALMDKADLSVETSVDGTNQLVISNTELSKFIKVLVNMSDPNNPKQNFGISFGSVTELLEFISKLNVTDLESKLLVSILNQSIFKDEFIKNAFLTSYKAKVPTFTYTKRNVYVITKGNMSEVEFNNFATTNIEYVTKEEFVTFINTPSTSIPSIPQV